MYKGTRNDMSRHNSSFAQRDNTAWRMTCFLAISCLLAVAGSTLAIAPLEVALQNTLDQWTYPRYAYNYAVDDPHTGDNKAQWEQRDGDAVKGSYSLVEPDGSLRVVDYAADDHSGFNAVVKRLGPNLHPAPHPLKPLSAWPIVVNPAAQPQPLLRPPNPLSLHSAVWPQPAWRGLPWHYLGGYGGWAPVRGKAPAPRPTRFITISASKNGRKTWIAGPIPVIPGKVFVVKRKN